MRPLTIAVDVDEVVAALIPEWLRRYNCDYEDNLTVDEVDRWELDEVVKPECGKRIFNYLHQVDLYDHVLPIPGARPAVYEMLAMGHRIIYATSCPRGTSEAKLDWLLHWGFLTRVNAHRDFVPVADKSLIRADFLFDDRLENLTGFSGQGWLVNQNHNRKQPWRHRIDGLRAAPGVIRSFA